MEINGHRYFMYYHFVKLCNKTRHPEHVHNNTTSIQFLNFNFFVV